jgi:ATP-binding protein involved in chromosome partitioning
MHEQPNLATAISKLLLEVKLANKIVDLAKYVQVINVDAKLGVATLALRLPFYWYNLTQVLNDLLQPALGKIKLVLQLEYKIYAHINTNKVKVLPEIKNIIAVVSGKGGVGKSTVATNLALALQQLGAKVGLLDADIYGPSVPQMLHTQDIKPVITAEKLIEPIIAFNMPTISIGNLIDESAAAIWRGPMVSSALQQLLFQTNWPKLDYLIIDLPPGTGDIQLTMAQKIPVTGALIVTTPQDVATIDATKAVTMLKKVNIEILGVVANMSYFMCDGCDKKHLLFNASNTKDITTKFAEEILIQLPLVPKIAYHADSGVPYMAAASQADNHYQQLMLLASKISYKIAQLPKKMQLPTAIVTQ